MGMAKSLGQRMTNAKSNISALRHLSRHVSPGNDRKLEQPARNRAVEERRFLGDLEMDELGKAQVTGEEVRRPSCESLFQRVAQQRIERRHLLLVGQPDAVGR